MWTRSRKLISANYLPKLCTKWIPLVIILGQIIFILYCYDKTPTNETALGKFNKEITKKHLEILQLRSVLKRNNVPESKYINKSLPHIYIITPTHTRYEQKAELTRLKNIFLHIPALHWIVVEDHFSQTPMVSEFLHASSLNYTHLYKETPKSQKLKSQDPRWRKPRGVLQRNEGMLWLRENVNPSTHGVVYFADDDNTYTIELFEEMRYTNEVSVWPVGLVGGMLVESPRVNENSKVIGWDVGFGAERQFATDMAGFAVSLRHLLSVNSAMFNYSSKIGHLETDFLAQLTTLERLEPKANRCTEIYVWHTQTKAPNLNQMLKMKAKNQNHKTHNIL